MKIHFSGAAGEVTGSKHLIEINGKFILFDCGLFQGRRKESYQKNKDFPFNPKKIDAVVVSHAHLDHCGNLPTLFKKGYTGKIFTSLASADIIPMMLNDSAYIQEMDSKFVAKHIKNPAIPAQPLYTKKDLPPVFAALEGYAYHAKTEILPGIFLEFHRSGHILGSAVVQLSFFEENPKTGEKEEKILVFTGDLGQKGKNLLHNPQAPQKADYLITESTYGNRIHKDASKSRENLAEIIHETIKRGGKIIVPSFSLQRTQEVIYDLHILQKTGEIPEIPIIIDSPLATRVTEIYKKYRSDFDSSTYADFLTEGDVPLEGENIRYTHTVEESKKLARLKGSAIILSASGMCEGGRIRHHLKNEIGKPENMILFVGYQAAYTLGRKILERRPNIKILGENFRVRAHIKKINGYSGHADRANLLSFIDKISGLKNVFVVHGEPSQSYEFAKILRSQKNRNWTIDIPESGDVIDPDEVYWDGKV